MNWNDELKSIRNHRADVRIQAKDIMIELRKSVREGSNGKVFGYHIPPEVGKILTEQGLAYKTFKEKHPDEFSMPFEESSVWIKE